jgi:hypothetical protein
MLGNVLDVIMPPILIAGTGAVICGIVLMLAVKRWRLWGVLRRRADDDLRTLQYARDTLARLISEDLPEKDIFISAYEVISSMLTDKRKKER